MQIRFPNGITLNAPDGSDPATVAKGYLASQAPKQEAFDNGSMSQDDTQKFLQSQYATSTGGGLTEGVKGAADVAAGAVSRGVVSPFFRGASSLAAKVSNNDPEEWKKWVDAIDYEPKTEGGKEVGRAVGQMGSEVAAPIKAGASYLDSKIKPAAESAGLGDAYANTKEFASELGDTAGDVASLLPGVGAARTAVGLVKDAKAASQVAAAAKAAKDAAEIARPESMVEELRREGLKLRPSDVSKLSPGVETSMRAKALESGVGADEAARMLNVENTGLIQKRAAQSLGVDLSKSNGALTDEMYAELKAPHNAVYDEVAQLPEPATIGPLTNFRGKIGGIDTAEMSTTAATEVERLKTRYLNGSGAVSSQRLVDDVKELRAKAKKLIQSEDPDMNERGWASKKIADALDGELTARARAYGSPELSERFDRSRAALAKIHTWEDATRAGTIDPKLVEKAKEKGVPVHLDPHLSFVAKASEWAPGVTKHPMKVGEVGVPPARGGSRIFQDAAQFVIRKSGGGPILRGAYQRSLDRKSPIGSRSRALSTVPGERYAGPGARPARNEGLNAGDDRGVSGSHPGTARPAPLRLPAPGQLADRPVSMLPEGTARPAINHPGYPALVSPEPMGLADSPLPGTPPGTGVPAHRVLVQPVNTLTTNRGMQRPGPVRMHRNVPPENITLAPGERNRKPTVAQKRGRKLDDKLR